jgi:hypothetical protein
MRQRETTKLEKMNICFGRALVAMEIHIAPCHYVCKVDYNGIGTILNSLIYIPQFSFLVGRSLVQNRIKIYSKQKQETYASLEPISPP